MLSFDCSNATVKEELLALRNHYEINSFKCLNESSDSEKYVVGIFLPFYSENPAEDKYWWAKMEADLIIPASFPIESPSLKIVSIIFKTLMFVMLSLLE